MLLIVPCCKFSKVSLLLNLPCTTTIKLTFENLGAADAADRALLSRGGLGGTAGGNSQNSFLL